MGVILNDAKAKWKTKKTLLQTLIDACPMKDSEFTEILEAYETDEEEAMNLMVNCTDGKFSRPSGEGWEFELND